MLQVTDKLLRDMTDLIVKECAPQKVILFGSHARGTAGDNSDLDFMIIENFTKVGKSREETLSDLCQLLFDYDLPIDLLLYSPEEVTKWSKAKNHVVAHALREGKVLYERH